MVARPTERDAIFLNERYRMQLNRCGLAPILSRDPSKRVQLQLTVPGARSVRGHGAPSPPTIPTQRDTL